MLLEQLMNLVQAFSAYKDNVALYRNLTNERRGELFRNTKSPCTAGNKQSSVCKSILLYNIHQHYGIIDSPADIIS